MPATGVRALDQSQAVQVIRLYDTGDYTQRELARRFGVSQGTISNIVTSRFYVNRRMRSVKVEND